MAIANSSSGKARKMSINRLMRVSTLPPKNPAVTPSTVPRVTDSSVARNATSSEICEPATMRLKMSRPLTGSTPSRKSLLMPPQSPLGLLNTGSMRSTCGSLGGCPSSPMMPPKGHLAKTATKIRNSTMQPPAIATLSRLRRIQAISRGDRPRTSPTPA